MANSFNYSSLEQIHTGICMNLLVDRDHLKKSWDLFKQISENYSLDGDPLHWLCCSLYIECLNSAKNVKIGQYAEEEFSLAKILKCYNISLHQFLNKMQRWIEMATIPNYIMLKIKKLEKKYEVSTLLFQKFQPIFESIFAGPLASNYKKAIKKQKSLNVNSLYDFTWCLYACVKSEFHQTSDNLVDMYHILLSCIDYIFQNVFTSAKVDLLKQDFKGLPQGFNNDDYTFPLKAPSIIPTLCEMQACSLIEVTTTKQYSWTPVIQSFFKKNILQGNKNTLMGILDTNFEENLKSLNSTYENYIYGIGEFDERTYLVEDPSSSKGLLKSAKRTEAMDTENTSPQAPDTPLTGRDYLKKRAEHLTPVSEATNSIARLRAYLSGCKPQPSSQLMQLFKDCGINEETIAQYVTSPCKKWKEQFASSLQECSRETVINRTNMVTMLHYKVFEHIVRDERRKKPHVPLESLLKEEVFQVTVYACCAEVVLHAYSVYALKFPRVLTIFQLSAFHFYKIIELVVLATMEKLSRDVIKHLNAVEEQVLESLVWTSDSPLWTKLESLGDGAIPASAEVNGKGNSPLPPTRQIRNVIQSPVSSTSTDRLSTLSVDQAKKQLFTDSIQPGQSLLVKKNIAIVTPNAEATAKKGNKNGSLMLFFRKFYSLAVVRMDYLCSSLRLSDKELLMKIWTCLEYSIVNQTHMMRDRHLDQILMCAVYVICKVSNTPSNPVERSFTEIMRCYRQQPQADNHVYRSVLIMDNERGDLIRFYNKVYVLCMQAFALKFTGKHKDECSLSPLPAGRGSALASPACGGQRVSEKHQFFVRPLTSPLPQSHHLTYRFSRSPAKDLHAINSMLSCELGVLKRNNDSSDDNALVKRAKFDAPASVARKLQGLIIDRQAVQ